MKMTSKQKMKTAKRYTETEKQEILRFVNKVNQERGLQFLFLRMQQQLKSFRD